MTAKEFFETIGNFTDNIYNVYRTNEFKKNVDLAYRRGLDLKLLKDVVHTIAKGEELDPKHVPHTLTGMEGKYRNLPLWECHIKPDWLLTWQQDGNDFILMLVATGIHSDLF